MRENVPKIQIEGEDNSALSNSFRRDLRIGQTNQAFVAEMNGIVISRAQRLDCRERHAHVGQESHAAGLLKNPISSFARAEAY